MAKFVKEIEPTEKSYLVELTQSEIDVLAGMVVDFCDNPQRKVRMVYEVDESVSFPNPRGMKVIEGLAKCLDGIAGNTGDYDYDDYWNTVRLNSIDYNSGFFGS